MHASKVSPPPPPEVLAVVAPGLVLEVVGGGDDPPLPGKVAVVPTGLGTVVVTPPGVVTMVASLPRNVDVVGGGKGATRGTCGAAAPMAEVGSTLGAVTGLVGAAVIAEGDRDSDPLCLPRGDVGAAVVMPEPPVVPPRL